ncbi:MAG: DUF6644 family protein, partial [Candidatus Rokuibacteriota bacterium]
LWLYPIVEIVHIVGFTVLVGAAVSFDLRLLGISRSLPVAGLERHLLPWARRALVLVVPSGVMMFMAHATEFLDNPAFLLKMLFLAAAGLNAGLFHRFTFRSVPLWDSETAAPAAAKLAAVASLGLWIGVISCGRLLAYL